MLSVTPCFPKWMGVAGGAPVFTLMLHSWTQDLQQHIHVHAVMACGVLDKAGQWLTPTRKPDFLFPGHALSKVFRESSCRERRSQLYKHDWVVYAKTSLGGPAQVLEYLSRYTHRTAISN